MVNGAAKVDTNSLIGLVAGQGELVTLLSFWEKKKVFLTDTKNRIVPKWIMVDGEGIMVKMSFLFHKMKHWLDF